MFQGREILCNELKLLLMIFCEYMKAYYATLSKLDFKRYYGKNIYYSILRAGVLTCRKISFQSLRVIESKTIYKRRGQVGQMFYVMAKQFKHNLTDT